MELLDIYYSSALELVKEASLIVSKGFTSMKNVSSKKAPWDILTEYDGQVEEFLITNLRSKFPSHKYLAEETSSQAQLGPDPTWIIDPIDGTINYASGYPESAISVALSINKEIVLGIVANPMRNLLFTAKKGQGSFLNGQRIHATRETDLQKAVIGYEIYGKIEKIRPINRVRLNALVSQARGIRAIGSAALGMCYVAAGMWDAYLVDYLAPWDYAAGSIIIKEAQGIVLDTSGKEFNIMNGKMMAAGTKELASVIVQIVKEADMKCFRQ